MQDEGVGVAAPQVGIPLRVAVVEDTPKYVDAWPSSWREQFARRPFKAHVLINPRLTPTSEEHVEWYEGCLSVPKIAGIVSRANSCRVEALDLKAEPVTYEASGWQARIYQHECDHLDGQLCVTKFKPGSLISAEEFKQLRDAEIARLEARSQE
jgi:peptide deformylase